MLELIRSAVAPLLDCLLTLPSSGITTASKTYQPDAIQTVVCEGGDTAARKTVIAV